MKMVKSKILVKSVDLLYNTLLRCVKGSEQRAVRSLFYRKDSHYRWLEW